MKSNVIAAAILVSAMSTMAFGQAAEKIGADAGKAAVEAGKAAQSVGGAASSSAAAAAQVFGKGAKAANDDIFHQNSKATNNAMVLKTHNTNEGSLGPSSPSNGNLGQYVSGAEIEQLNVAISHHVVPSTKCFEEKFDAQTIAPAVHEAIAFDRTFNKDVSQLTTEENIQANMSSAKSIATDLKTTTADGAEREAALCELGCDKGADACAGSKEAAARLAKQ